MSFKHCGELQTDGERIQRDIAEYAELSQQVMQLTTIISDSVEKTPARAGDQSIGARDIRFAARAGLDQQR